MAQLVQARVPKVVCSGGGHVARRSEKPMGLAAVRVLADSEVELTLTFNAEVYDIPNEHAVDSGLSRRAEVATQEAW